MVDDPIGSFQIGGQQMADAARAGVVQQVNVSRQTNNTVLFVGVSVMPE